MLKATLLNQTLDPRVSAKYRSSSPPNPVTIFAYISNPYTPYGKATLYVSTHTNGSVQKRFFFEVLKDA